MRKPIGMAVGFAVGYYLGSMAGRERHEQINEVLRKAQQSGPVDLAGQKAKAVVGRGRERVRGGWGPAQPGEDQGEEGGNSASSGTTAEGAVE